MKVNFVKVNHLKKLRKLDVRLQAPVNEHFGQLKVTVIVGENGTGKTTLLQALVNSLVNLPSDQARSRKVPNVEVGCDLGDRTFTFAWPRNRGELRDLKVNLLVSASSDASPFPRDSIHTVEDVKYRYIGMASPGEAKRFELLYQPLLRLLYAGTEQQQRALRGLLDEMGYLGDPHVVLRKSPKFKGKVVRQFSWDNQEPLSKALGKQSPWVMLLQPVIDHLRENSRSAKERRNVRLFPAARLQDFPGGPDKCLNLLTMAEDAGLALVQDLLFPNGDELVSLSDMSSGEQNLFFRFLDLVRYMADDTLVLIDEPETHLHPRFIQMYVSLLAQTFGHYNSHIILATHSPFIAGDVPRECIVGLRVRPKDPKRPVELYAVQDQTLGATQGEVLREIFHLERFLGLHTMSTVNRVRGLWAEGKRDQAARLFDDLGDSHEKFKLFMLIEDERRGRE